MSRRRSIVAFVAEDGTVRDLREPHLPATPKQLARLNHEGLLELRDERGVPISKGEAAFAIDTVKRPA